MARITEELTRNLALRMLKDTNWSSVKEELKKKGYSGSQVLKVIESAKQYIKEMTESLKDVQSEINMLRLNAIADNRNTLNADKIKAVDLLNKMMGNYSQKIELNRDVTFILGDMGDDWVNNNERTKEDIEDFISENDEEQG